MKKAKTISMIFFICSAVIFLFCLLTNKAGVDKNGPKIEMDSEEIQVSISDEKEAMLAGVTATDSKDGDVTGSLVVEGISNFIEKGRRKVSIVAFDSDNNITRVTREVVYTDYESPKFNLNAPLLFSMDELEYTKGMTVTDCLDGDITNRIRITYEEAMNYGAAGEKTLTFSVSNSAGDSLKLPVTVEFYDEETRNNPRVELTEYLVNMKVGEKISPADYIEGVTIDGRYYENDGDSSFDFSDIAIQNPVDGQTPGVFEVEYSVTDSSDRTGVVRLIVVVEE